jgi:four helix bundle protein
MESYRELIAWQKSIDLVVAIYKITATFPKTEQYGLTNQMRRAAISIPSNIAEGYYRGHLNEYVRFVKIAFASGGELETQSLVAERLKFLSAEENREIEFLLSQVMKLLNKLIQSLENKK